MSHEYLPPRPDSPPPPYQEVDPGQSPAVGRVGVTEIREDNFNNNGSPLRIRNIKLQKCQGSDYRRRRRRSSGRRYSEPPIVSCDATTTGVVAPVKVSDRVYDYAFLPEIKHPQLKQMLLEEISRQKSNACTRSHVNVAVIRSYGNCVMQYQLETFYETRKKEKRMRPYKGGSIREKNHRKQSRKEIHCEPKKYFENGKREVEDRNSTKVEVCGKCEGRYVQPCSQCVHGLITCWYCNGNSRAFFDNTQDKRNQGMYRDEECRQCYGQGQSKCTRCDEGQVQCTQCFGYGRMETYDVITFQWTVKRSNALSDDFGVPQKIITNQDAKTFYMTEDEQLTKLTELDCVKSDLVDMANIHLQTHQNTRQGVTIKRQRHKIRIIPITQVQFLHNDKKKIGTVIGYNNYVHIEKSKSSCKIM